MAKGFNSRGMLGGGMNMNMNMLRQAQKMQADLEKIQADLEQKTYSVKAGGGMVEAVVSGKKQLSKLTIRPEAMDPEDPGMLEDLVLLAVNEALRLAEEDANQGISKLTGSLNLPGLGL